MKTIATVPVLNYSDDIDVVTENALTLFQYIHRCCTISIVDCSLSVRALATVLLLKRLVLEAFQIFL